MTSYASTRAAPAAGLLNASTYWKITAPVLLAVAVLGFAMNAMGIGGLIPILAFDTAHNLVHLLLAATGFYLGYAATPALAQSLAKVIGIVYLGLGLVGFVTANVFGIGDLLGLHLELGENVIHVALGAWATFVGFAR